MRRSQEIRTIIVVAGLVFVVVGCISKPFPNVSEQQFLVTPNVLLAGELLESSFGDFAEQDIVVIDLRTADEGISLEAQLLAKKDVPYVNLPVERGISHEQVMRFDALLREHHDRRIIVHCASGNRAGMLWGAYLIERGTSVSEAQQKVDRIVTKAPVKTAIEQYARERGK